MIRLSLATDFALRTLLYLGNHPGEQASTREVAEFYRISVDHVSKVTQQLTHAGYVRAGRGRKGGIRLARLPEQIRVGEVVQLFEGAVALLDCVTQENVCVIQPGCRLRTVLARAGEQLIRELNQVTLADLLGDVPGSLVQLQTTANTSDCRSEEIASHAIEEH